MSVTTIGAQLDGGPLVGTDQFVIERIGGANFKITSDQLATFIGSSPLTTKGDLYGFDTVDARIPIGTNGQVLTANSAQALGLEWADASSILAAKGDLLTRNILNDIALNVGADGQVLVADSAEATGLKWADAASGGGLSGWNANYAYYYQGEGVPDYYYDLTAEYESASTFYYLYRAIPKDTTLTAFCVKADTNPVDADVEFYVQINNVDTALKVTVPALTIGVFAIEVDVPVSQGDLINLHLIELPGGSSGDNMEIVWTIM
jgi:hypothetical protein